MEQVPLQRPLKRCYSEFKDVGKVTEIVRERL